MRPETIAIDGPAGSGKSTIGQALATRLNYAMVDTGLIYRLVARGVLDAAVDPDDREAVLKVSVGVLKDVEVARTDTGGVINVAGLAAVGAAAARRRHYPDRPSRRPLRAGAGGGQADTAARHIGGADHPGGA